MANSADSSQTVQGRYVQPRAVYLRKRALELTLLAMLLFGGVGAGVSSVFWIDTNPSVSRWNWLLPLIAVAAVLEVLLLKGPELVRHRFVVDESGFTPPFFRSARQRSGGETTIPFDWVDRVATRTYTQAGRTRVYGIALALKDGRRVVIRESDVGEDGIRRLSTALSVARPSSGGSTDSERQRQTDQGRRRALREELLPAVGLLVILALAVIALVAVGNPRSYAGLALATIAALGTAFGIGWIFSIRRRTKPNG